jgi:hypothetical protein
MQMFSNVNSGQSGSYAVLDGSNIYVTWNDTRSGASNYFIYLQRLDTSGTVLWNPGWIPALQSQQLSTGTKAGGK